MGIPLRENEQQSSRRDWPADPRQSRGRYKVGGAVRPAGSTSPPVAMAGTLAVRMVTRAALLAVLVSPGWAAAPGAPVEGSGAGPAAPQVTSTSAVQTAGNGETGNGGGQAPWRWRAGPGDRRLSLARLTERWF